MTVDVPLEPLEPTGPLERQRLRRAFGTFPTGVTVVTVGGDPHGMTANSFTAVSLDPPLVLVCVERDAIMHACLLLTSRFGVSVLAADQAEVARHFADRRRALGRAQFDPVAWAAGPVTGAPLITGAVAHFECELWRFYDGGDHTIFLGRLLSARHGPAADPLLFLHGSLRRYPTSEAR